MNPNSDVAQKPSPKPTLKPAQKAAPKPAPKSAPEQNVQTVLPAVDVVEDASGILLHADFPGVPKEKLSVHIEADILTIEGEVILGLPSELELKHIEQSGLRYRRVFTLSKELDTDKVVAEFKLGVLKLRIPKAEQAKPRRVKIKVK